MMNLRKIGLYVMIILLNSLPSAGSGAEIQPKMNKPLDALEILKGRIYSYSQIPRKSEKARADVSEKYPKIIVIKDKLLFEGKELRLGDSMDSWKKIIAGDPRCFQDKPQFCVWDDTGLEIKTRGDQNKSITSFTIHFNFFNVGQNGNKYGVSSSPTPAEIYDWLPHKVFNGYFELDGFGIDSSTQFRDVLSNVTNRNLRCGTFDCSNPSGTFSEEADIYISLDSRRDSGRVKEFSLAKDL
jgi:hypothetical protein